MEPEMSKESSLSSGQLEDGQTAKDAYNTEEDTAKLKKRRRGFDVLPSDSANKVLNHHAHQPLGESGMNNKSNTVSSSTCSSTAGSREAEECVTDKVSKKHRYHPNVPEGINFLTGRTLSPRYYELLEKRKQLPAYELRKTFIKTIRKNPITILTGDTGTGKTTQCAQFLLEAGLNKGKCVACTQPRRVAAISVARRVAEEMDVNLGEHVGYTVRFEDKSSSVTVLKFVTDGMLLREASTSANLDRYSIVMLDEAHERTLSTDILFGLLKEIRTLRPDLKLIIMSATLDAGRFQEYFNGAPIVQIPGRAFPVDILYTKEPEANYFEAALATVLQVHRTEPPGDVLVFLTGEEEIEQMKASLEKEQNKMRMSPNVGELVILPLYSSLPPQQQMKIFEPAPPARYAGGPPGRKVIIATNVAETSITVDGIVYVVDPGFSKQKVFDPRVRVESLLVAPISQASARQRSGRAGRTRPGKCFRLYTELSFNKELLPQTYPEILRSNLGSVVLVLLKLGVKDLVHFDFMEPPAPETMMRALEELHYLDALGEDGNLTPVGEVMAEFPLDPQLAKMVVESPKYKCTNEIITIAAILNVPNIFLRPKDQATQADDAKTDFVNETGDHVTLLNAFIAYKQNDSQVKQFCWDHFLHPRSLQTASNVRDQLLKMFVKLDLEVISTPQKHPDYYTNICKGILAGFFMQVAYSQGNPRSTSVYVTVKDHQVVALHPSCCLAKGAEWVVYHEYVLTSKNFIRTVTAVEPEWLLSVAPRFYDLDQMEDGEAKRRLVSVRNDIRKTR